MILPFIPLFFWSFSSGWHWPYLFPIWGLRVWKYLFATYSEVITATVISMWIALITTLLNLLLAFPAAYALVRYSFRGKRWVEILFLAPLIVPPFVAVMGMYATLIRWNLTDTLFGVILVHMIPTFPYLFRPILLRFRTLGTKWEDQARMLRANGIQRFRYVVLPFLMPAIVVGVSFSVLVSLSQYLLTLLVGGGLIQTLPLVMFPYIGGGGDATIGAGYAILFVFVSVFLLGTMEWMSRKYARNQTWI